MGLSVGFTSNPVLPGLRLKAWALVRADGTLVKGDSMSIVRTAAGTYTVTFTTPTGTDYIAVGRLSDASSFCSADSIAAATCRVIVQLQNQTLQDRGNFHVAFWE